MCWVPRQKTGNWSFFISEFLTCNTEAPTLVEVDEGDSGGALLPLEPRQKGGVHNEAGRGGPGL